MYLKKINEKLMKKIKSLNNNNTYKIENLSDIVEVIVDETTNEIINDIKVELSNVIVHLSKIDELNNEIKNLNKKIDKYNKYNTFSFIFFISMSTGFLYYVL